MSEETVAQLTMVEILRETIEYYAEGGRFSVTPTKTCLYYNKDTKNRCAVGRCFGDDRFNNSRDSIDTLIDKYSPEELEECLKPQYRKAPLWFWIKLQVIHDSWAIENSLGATRVLSELCEDLDVKMEEVLRGIEFKISNPFISE